MQHVAVPLITEHGQALGGRVPDHLALVPEQGYQDGLELGESVDGGKPPVASLNALASC
jgi:hypothetical protein